LNERLASGTRDSVTYPWTIDLAVLERDYLLNITGMGLHALNAISSHLPGEFSVGTAGRAAHQLADHDQV
jgi:hypothetical protein